MLTFPLCVTPTSAIFPRALSRQHSYGLVGCVDSVHVMRYGVQALWEWSVLLPVTAAQASAPEQDMGAWGWIGFVVYMLLFLFETGGAALATPQQTPANCILLPCLSAAPPVSTM